MAPSPKYSTAQGARLGKGWRALQSACVLLASPCTAQGEVKECDVSLLSLSTIEACSCGPRKTARPSTHHSRANADHEVLALGGIHGPSITVKGAVRPTYRAQLSTRRTVFHLGSPQPQWLQRVGQYQGKMPVGRTYALTVCNERSRSARLKQVPYVATLQIKSS